MKPQTKKKSGQPKSPTNGVKCRGGVNGLYPTEISSYDIERAKHLAILKLSAINKRLFTGFMFIPVTHDGLKEISNTCCYRCVLSYNQTKPIIKNEIGECQDIKILLIDETITTSNKSENNIPMILFQIYYAKSEKDIPETLKKTPLVSMSATSMYDWKKREPETIKPIKKKWWKKWL